MAFEAPEQERSAREPTHIVGTEDDARQIPDCIGHTPSSKRISRSAGQPDVQPRCRELGPSVFRHRRRRGSGQRSLATGRRPAVTRHGVKAITAPEIVGEQPASLEAGQHAGVRGVVTEQDTDLVALYPAARKPAVASNA